MAVVVVEDKRDAEVKRIINPREVQVPWNSREFANQGGIGKPSSVELRPRISYCGGDGDKARLSPKPSATGSAWANRARRGRRRQAQGGDSLVDLRSDGSARRVIRLARLESDHGRLLVAFQYGVIRCRMISGPEGLAGKSQEQPALRAISNSKICEAASSTLRAFRRARISERLRRRLSAARKSRDSDVG